MLEVIQWACWIIMLTALGGVAIFMIAEPFLPKREVTEEKGEPRVVIRGDSEYFQKEAQKTKEAVGVLANKLVDTSRWHKRSTEFIIKHRELLDCVRPHELTNLIHSKALEWFEELKAEGLTVGASEHYWNPIMDPGNGDRVVKIVVNVIKTDDARES